MLLALGAGWALGGCQALYDSVGGSFAGPPTAMREELSPAALALVDGAMRGIDPGRFADLHVHIVGMGSGGTGAWVNPSAFSLLHPLERARTRVFMSAAGVGPGEHLDRDYVDRLIEQIRSIPGHGRYHILAFDWTYSPGGVRDPERSPVHTPNRYVVTLSERYPEYFIPVASVHPFRDDALEALERWAGRGCRFVKWLPNTMGIDPSLERLDPYYDKLVELGMVLLVHTGAELALRSRFAEYGNPLLLRRALDRGVRVVALHAASLGEFRDFERDGREALGYELLLRMMDEPAYEERLFAEISALTFSNHLIEPLQTLLERADLHPRLIHGSDYPVPGVHFLDGTQELVAQGFLDPEGGDALREIYAYNPLLFDLLLKRRLRHPRTGVSFPPGVFMLPEALGPQREAPTSP